MCRSDLDSSGKIAHWHCGKLRIYFVCLIYVVFSLVENLFLETSIMERIIQSVREPFLLSRLLFLRRR
jgi:hypothetical protein